MCNGYRYPPVYDNGYYTTFNEPFNGRVDARRFDFNDGYYHHNQYLQGFHDGVYANTYGRSRNCCCGYRNYYY